MSVTGIGGVFFRSDDPSALKAWYHKHLGISFDFKAPWVQEAGQTLFMPFSKGTDHFPADKQFMINFRVSDMNEMLAKLREAGIDVTTNPDWDTPKTGRFAHICDPEGNKIELWEPPAE